MIFTGADLIFNDYNFAADLFVEEIRAPFTAGSWFPQQTIPGRAGVLLGPRRETRSRTIEVDVRLIEDCRTDVTDKVTHLAGHLLTDAPVKLETRRDQGRWWMAVFHGETALEQLFDTGFATLEFLVPDGYMWSDLVTVNKATGASDVDFIGTRRCAPTFSITLTAATNAVSVALGGQKVEITRTTGTWAAESVVVFDHGTGTVEVGSELAMTYLTLGSRFFEIEPGEHEITFTGGGGSVQYYPRWA